MLLKDSYLHVCPQKTLLLMLFMEGRRVRNKKKNSSLRESENRRKRKIDLLRQVRFKKMASQKRQERSFLARFCFLTQLCVHLQDPSSFQIGSEQENTSYKSAWQLVQLYNSISSASVRLSHRIGWG